MSDLRRVGDLDITQDMEHEGREGRAQSIGWAIVLLLLGGAMAGLFGGGVLSSQVVGDEKNGIQVKYGRFERRHSESRLTLRVPGAASRQGAVRLWISRSFLDHVSVDGIQPEPEKRTFAADRVVYEFPTVDASEVSVTVLFRPDNIGPLATRVGVESGSDVHLWQFMYP